MQGSSRTDVLPEPLSKSLLCVGSKGSGETAPLAARLYVKYPNLMYCDMGYIARNPDLLHGKNNIHSLISPFVIHSIQSRISKFASNKISPF